MEGNNYKSRQGYQRKAMMTKEYKKRKKGKIDKKTYNFKLNKK